MPFAAEAITLMIEERLELEQMTQSRTLPAGDVFRARRRKAERWIDSRGPVASWQPKSESVKTRCSASGIRPG
jgi:hypothetical protein